MGSIDYSTDGKYTAVATMYIPGSSVTISFDNKYLVVVSSRYRIYILEVLDATTGSTLWTRRLPPMIGVSLLLQ